MPRRVSYRRLLVPIVGSPESERAVEIACSLAEQGAEVVIVYVIEVSQLLPLDARMEDEETAARSALHRAQAITDAYGVRLRGRKVRGREAGPAIVRVADELEADLVVIAAPSKRRVYGRSRLGSTVRHVLAKAPCPVLIASPPPA